MKILTIDDQELILMSLEKKFTELGYDVTTANIGSYGIELFDKINPDLVIVDINMHGVSGLDVIKHIRIDKKSETPILVLSGNINEATILDSFNLGINDYMKKPLSLNEIAARVKRIFGNKPHPQEPKEHKNAPVVQKHCVGVVIPCYNEADRLLGSEFANFAVNHPGYHLCFVNDGSTDNTLEVLKNLRKGNEDIISIYNCKKNGGKAEAVRQGVLYLSENPEFDYIGYLDADLSTNFSDFNALVNTLQDSEYQIVSGSRIDRMGANISKESARKLISMSINMIIQRILGMGFKDTQCGAKIMTREIALNMFNKKFLTRWLFDVEIFLRMRKYYGRDKVSQLICEQPLKRWVHMDGSKLSMKDSLKIVGQLTRIAVHYNS